jgi:uncharacterized protein YqiB (DUF1249 family)
MMTKGKYTIDLAGQHAECESNYARLIRLLPNMDSVDRREFGVELAGREPVRFCMEVKERCKYTTMLEVSQHSINADSISSQPWAIRPTFLLRIYHDAQMAEVISFNKHHQVQPKYDYPNEKMYQADEKAQLNQFLGEWLSHCIHYGHDLDDLADHVAKAVNL